MFVTLYYRLQKQSNAPPSESKLGRSVHTIVLGESLQMHMHCSLASGDSFELPPIVWIFGVDTENSPLGMLMVSSTVLSQCLGMIGCMILRKTF